MLLLAAPLLPAPILDDGRWLDVPATCACPVPGRPAHTSGWIGAEQSRAGAALGFSVPGVPAHCTRFIACAPARNAGLPPAPSASVPSDSDLTTAIIDARTTGSQVVVDPAVDLPTPHRPFAAHSFPHRQTHTGSASCVRKPSQAKRVGGSSATVPRTHACAAQQAAVPVRLPAACNLRAAGAFPSGLSDRSGCRRTRTHLPPYMYAYGVLRTCMAHAPTRVFAACWPAVVCVCSLPCGPRYRMALLSLLMIYIPFNFYDFEHFHQW
jgi:hypothetical protein